MSIEGESLRIGHENNPEGETAIWPSENGFTAIIFDRPNGHYGIASKLKSVIEIPGMAKEEDLTALLSHLPAATIGIVEAFIKGQDIKPLIEISGGHE